MHLMQHIATQPTASLGRESIGAGTFHMCLQFIQFACQADTIAQNCLYVNVYVHCIPLTGSGSGSAKVALSPQGTYAAATFGDYGDITLWHLASGEAKAKMTSSSAL